MKKILISALLCLSTLTMAAQLTIEYGIKTNQREWKFSQTDLRRGTKTHISTHYTMLTGKRHECHNKGKQTVYTLTNTAGDTLLLELRRYKDGLAFRYVLPNVKEGEAIVTENTSFRVPANTRRWMQRNDINNTGYEHFFPLCQGGISPEGERHTNWGYPALFQLSSGKYALISDSYDPRDNGGSYLANSLDERNRYAVRYFGEERPTGSRWHSAWHVVIEGTLADIVESTLVTDVAEQPSFDASWVEPGVASWIYWAYNHGSQEYDILKRYVDLAAEMKWHYTLVDAEWDVMRGGNIEQLCRYALSKGVDPIIWYNSSTAWTGSSAPTPQWLLNDPDKCEQEFAKIASWGVKGVKIDFFADDTQHLSRYYHQLITTAARHHLTVNFHGGTIPHGWQRTYPNVVTCEAVYGAEWYNNNSTLTNRAAQHNATLPFTRNVIGPMDYTPGTFTDSQHPHITSDCHELALPILFESGIQHMPDRPETYTNMPAPIKQLLSTLPTAWDDTRYLAGTPGDHAVLARQKGDIWYVAGINGRRESRTVSVPLSFLTKGRYDATLITDSPDRHFLIEQKSIRPSQRLTIPCASDGGFVIVIKRRE